MGLRNSGQERHENDWYVEPRWTVEALADAENIHGHNDFRSVWDPACGRGTIPGVFRNRRCDVLATDIVSRGCDPFGGVHDFLGGERYAPRIDWIITNPPYNNALEFATKALEYKCNVAILVPLTFLASQRRKAELFDKNPPTKVWIFSQRPSMPPGHVLEEMEARGEKPKGGSTDYCWIVWRRDTIAGPLSPTLGWLTKPAALEV